MYSFICIYTPVFQLFVFYEWDTGFAVKVLLLLGGLVFEFLRIELELYLKILFVYLKSLFYLNRVLLVFTIVWLHMRWQCCLGRCRSCALTACNRMLAVLHSPPRWGPFGLGTTPTCRLATVWSRLVLMAPVYWSSRCLGWYLFPCFPISTRQKYIFPAVLRPFPSSPRSVLRLLHPLSICAVKATGTQRGQGGVHRDGRHLYGPGWGIQRLLHQEPARCPVRPHLQFCGRGSQVHAGLILPFVYAAG